MVEVYRPPSAESQATDTLVNMLSKFSDEELLVLGDLNLNWLSDASLQFKNLMCSLNLSQLIMEPTRPNPKDGSKSTLLDLIFTNKAGKYSSSGVFELVISDHCPIACVRDVRVKKTASKVVSKRNFSKFDAEQFLGDLKDWDWSYLGQFNNVEVALDSFVAKFNYFVNKHAPYKAARIKDRVVPWVTHELSSLLNNRNSAWSRARHTGDPQHWLSFRQLRNKCTSAVRKAKSEYFLNLVTTSYSNPAKFWDAISMTKSHRSSALALSIKVNDRVISDPNDISLAFNKHFSEAGHLFDKLFPRSPPAEVSDDCTPLRHVPHFSLQPFTSSEVLRILQSVDPKSSTGEDHLDPFFYKTGCTNYL